jgi:hypothetical protein
MEPSRNFSNLDRETNAHIGSANAGETQTASGPAADVASSKDATDGRVELAYRVIEKHLTNGQRSAEQLNSKPYGTRPTSDGLQELVDQFLRYQAEMIPLWTELLGRLASPELMGAIYPAKVDSTTPRRNVSSNGGTNVCLELLSTQPVEVSLDLPPNSDGRQLRVLGLHAVDSDKPGLTDITFSPAKVDGHRKLRVFVPANQPAGSYSGVIVDRDTGELRGTLTVRVSK